MYAHFLGWLEAADCVVSGCRFCRGRMMPTRRPKARPVGDELPQPSWALSDCRRMPQRFDPSAFIGRTVKQMDDALRAHRGEATAEVTVEGESMPSAELVQLAGMVPAACVLYATTTRTQDTPELQWQLASYADVELLMGEAPTLIGCVHEDP